MEVHRGLHGASTDLHEGLHGASTDLHEDLHGAFMNLHGASTDLHGASVETPWRSPWAPMEASVKCHGVPDDVGVRVRVRVRCPTLWFEKNDMSRETKNKQNTN